MNRYRGLRTQPAKDLDRLDRADVAAGPHLSGLESERADRDQRQPDRPQRRRLARPAAVAEPGIAGEVQVAAGQRDDEAGPQGAVAIGEPAAAPVMVARDVDTDRLRQIGASLDGHRLAPIDRGRADPGRSQDRVIAQRRDDQRPVARPQPLQRRDVHMVIVVVAEQHDVDLRQVVQPHARRGHTLRTEAERSGGVAPYRVGQDVEILRLHQHARVTDPRRRHCIAGHARRGPGRRDRHRSRPWRPPVAPGRLSPEEAGPTTAGRSQRGIIAVRIEKTRTVEMVAHRPLVIDPVEETGKDRRRQPDENAEPEQADQDIAKRVSHRGPALEATIRSTKPCPTGVDPPDLRPLPATWLPRFIHLGDRNCGRSATIALFSRIFLDALQHYPPRGIQTAPGTRTPSFSDGRPDPLLEG